MSRPHLSRWIVALCAVALSLLVSCEAGTARVGSQTNWLAACRTSSDCGDLECLCGICTSSCEDDADCAEPSGGSCVAPSHDGAVAVCDGARPSTGLCLASCDGGCPDETECMAGVCRPISEPTVRVSLDPSLRYQTLVGFGASLAYDEDALDAHPERSALLDALFVEAGFDVIRLRNRFEGDNAAVLGVAAGLVDEAEARLGRRPTLVLTSGSPPAALKANGDRFCVDSNPSCTLARDGEGRFDYGAFAQHWRASLEAYRAVGIEADFVSLQNNPDWIPDTMAFEACRFLPREGVTTVGTPEGDVEAEFPGYVEALAAVTEATRDLGTITFTGPETANMAMMSGYLEQLDPSTVGALSFHLYGTDPNAIDTGAFDDLRRAAQTAGRPLLQTEMQAAGSDSARLIHHALVTSGAAAYLHHQFVAVGGGEEAMALLATDETSFEKLLPYHALAHYARTTEPGFFRIEGTSTSDELLASAWISPGEDAITIVLVNTANEAFDVGLGSSSEITLLEGASVTRTVFEGEERSADLGVLGPSRVVRVPPNSIVTIASTR